MNTRRAAIIHTVLAVLAFVPAIGLSVGLIIGAGDAGAGVFGNAVAWMAGAFPIVLPVSVIFTWIAYNLKRPRVEWFAIAVPWVYLAALIVVTIVTFTLLSQPLSPD